MRKPEKILKYPKLMAWILLTSVFFWLLNNGFSSDNLRLTGQAIFFALVSLIVFKYKKLSLQHWFLITTLFYLVSMVLEMFKIVPYSEIFANTGFGILTIVIASEVFTRLSTHDY